MPFSRKLQHLVDDVSLIDDPQERLGLIVDRAKRVAPLAAADRIDSNRVRGCVSVVWLVGELREGRVYFRGDAESPVVRGLVVMLCEFFSGHSPEDVLLTDANPLVGLGLLENLSPTRRNGLESARDRIRELARDFSAQLACRARAPSPNG